MRPPLLLPDDLLGVEQGLFVMMGSSYSSDVSGWKKPQLKGLNIVLVFQIAKDFWSVVWFD